MGRVAGNGGAAAKARGARAGVLGDGSQSTVGKDDERRGCAHRERGPDPSAAGPFLHRHQGLVDGEGTDPGRKVRAGRGYCVEVSVMCPACCL